MIMLVSHGQISNIDLAGAWPAVLDMCDSLGFAGFVAFLLRNLRVCMAPLIGYQYSFSLREEERCIEDISLNGERVGQDQPRDCRRDDVFEQNLSKFIAFYIGNALR
jgi:hypothetical protein